MPKPTAFPERPLVGAGFAACPACGGVVLERPGAGALGRWRTPALGQEHDCAAWRVLVAVWQTAEEERR